MDYYSTAHERRRKEAAIKARTVRVGLGYRLWLRDAVRWALWTGGHSHDRLAFLRLFLPEFNANAKFRKAYAQNPSRFSEDIAHHGLGGRLGARLEDFKQGHGDLPFLVIRKLMPRCYFPWSYSASLSATKFNHETPKISGQQWYLRKSYYELIGSGLLSALGMHHRSRSFSEEAIFRDYFTSPGAEIDQFGRDEDIPRRWRQAIPEFGLVDEPAASSGLLTARYAVYVCVENPIRDPIWVLPAYHVIDRLTEDEKAKLKRSSFDFFDHWSSNLSSRGLTMIQKILGGDNVKVEPGQGEHYNKWMSFDANRIYLEHPQTKPEEREAVGALRNAMQAAAEEHALPIMLHRGDVLIVDNYRALVRRTERKHRWIHPLLWGRPPVRWLRMYCGFPPTPTNPSKTSATKA